MGRKKNETDSTVSNPLILLFMVSLVSCALVYTFVSALLTTSSVSDSGSLALVVENGATGSRTDNGGGCCRGIENLELWGAAVKWGSEFKFNNSEGCCNACKSMCNGKDGPCLCDTWVFCGNRDNCGSRFGEGIIGLGTEYGTLHVKLFPDCAPHSVTYILELLPLRHCAGCQFYRAEGRGQSWDSEGNHIKNAAFGPPVALIQGTLEAQGTVFKKIPIEDCPTIRRGSVAWIGSGPEFFVSLANHGEWKKEYSVFGSVLPEDMHIAERISTLPTISDVWNNINVTVLEKPVPLMLRRIKKSHEDFNKANSA